LSASRDDGFQPKRRLGGRCYTARVQRIASLLPSATEIVCALGFEAALVGRSHECDYPDSVGGLPVLTQAKLDVHSSSAEIDQRVKQLVSQGLSVYCVDAELLQGLEPSVILTQDQCEVCAASPRDIEAALGTWLATPPRVVSLSPSTLEDVWNDIRRVARVLAAPQRGEDVTAAINQRIAEISKRVRGRAVLPSVACIEWIDPLMAAGNWIPELVTLAGGRPVVGEVGTDSPWLDWEELHAVDPDVIIVMPCGFDLDRTGRELEPLRANPIWTGLRAVGEGRVYLTDGSQYFNRPGPRLIDSLEILSQILHPEDSPATRRATGWKRLAPGS
jgi:iron complex transport system substrate-binding protein